MDRASLFRAAQLATSCALGDLVHVNARGARERLFLVDGYALVYRAFHAVAGRPLTTSRGENTAIPWGVANFVERLRRDHAPEYLAWIHDAGQSDRDTLYAEYKATRVALSTEEQADFDRGVERVAALLAAHSIPLLTVPGFEADDVIATLAASAVAADLDVVVVSPDKDLLQLVRSGVRVLNPYHGRPGATTERWYDASNATDRLGVPPHQVADFLALVGDASDNVPGVRGIGEKGARKLLESWGTLENILANVDQVTPPRTRDMLREHAATARLSRDLVTARTDVPVALDLRMLEAKPSDATALRLLYTELEFATLLRSLPRDTDATTSAASAITYGLVERAEAVDALVARARAAGRIALALMTELEPGAPAAAGPLRARATSMAIAVAPGDAWYLPLAHRRPGGQGEFQLGGDTDPTVANLPALDDPRMRQLVALLEDPAIEKVVHNAKFDMLVLRRAGVFLRGLVFDTMLASYLLDPGRRSHGLDQLAVDVLKRTMLSVPQPRGKNKNTPSVAELAPDVARDVVCQTADYTLQAADILQRTLDDHGLTPLMRDLELPLLAVLADMEAAGVAIDLAWFASLKTRFENARRDVEQRIWSEAGGEFNINSNAQLRDVLFTKLALPVKKRTATGPSTDATVLQELAEEGHALPVLLMEFRELAKLESTYIDALPALVNPDTGRLHTSYSQTVAATGRLSSSEPNLQNIPVRTELGRDIRRGFVPRSGWRFLAADYSQIELRLLAHLSGDDKFVGAFRAGDDIHRQTAAAIFGVSVDAVTPEMRARAKTINFATIYGQGPFSLSRQLRIDVEEAKQFIATYFERFAGVRRFLDQSVEHARDRGYAETLFGRRRYIPELRDRNYNVRAFGERVAQNSPIQGSAADLIKRAMLRIADELRRSALQSEMLLQVHDELVFEGPPDELAALQALVVEAMEDAADLAVPLVVDVGTGLTWLDTKPA